MYLLSYLIFSTHFHTSFYIQKLLCLTQCFVNRNLVQCRQEYFTRIFIVRCTIFLHISVMNLYVNIDLYHNKRCYFGVIIFFFILLRSSNSIERWKDLYLRIQFIIRLVNVVYSVIHTALFLTCDFSSKMFVKHFQ